MSKFYQLEFSVLIHHPYKSATDFTEFSEDCLFLNIQVKKTVLENREKRPIVYFIHGGGFNGGSGQGNFPFKIAVTNLFFSKVHRLKI